MVSFVADGQTLPDMRVECDIASSVSDAKKQRYVHEFTSLCISDQLQDVTLRLDSHHLLKHALTPVRPSDPLTPHSRHDGTVGPILLGGVRWSPAQEEKAVGKSIIGCDRVRLMLNARKLGQPRVVSKLHFQRDVCSKGSYFSAEASECVDCRPCNNAASVASGAQPAIARAPHGSEAGPLQQRCVLCSMVESSILPLTRSSVALVGPLTRPDNSSVDAGRGAPGDANRAPAVSTP